MGIFLNHCCLFRYFVALFSSLTVIHYNGFLLFSQKISIVGVLVTLPSQMLFCLILLFVCKVSDKFFTWLADKTYFFSCKFQIFSLSMFF
jgi:hypothetical protein